MMIWPRDLISIQDKTILWDIPFLIHDHTLPHGGYFRRTTEKAFSNEVKIGLNIPSGNI